ncbi:major facilitator superfamily domain-containing protein [Fennellomyces sp. T-0311]|nr:major facilitator superfamily domain-containing protein [Fennellomyces sp. T-0311]
MYPAEETITSQPYSVFSKSYKRVMVIIVTINSIFLFMSYNTYSPALDAIRQSFNTTVENVNLTITAYSLLQGIAPLICGPFADTWGRRPVLLIIFIIYIGSGIGLALVSSFEAFVVLRMIQAFGSGPVISIGAGVIGDIATAEERGGFFGVVTGGLMFSSVFGIFIGGTITYTLSWRWIFWVLALAGILSFLMTYILLPETLRSLVGNGSGYANPTPLQWLTRRQKSTFFLCRGMPNPLKQLQGILEPDSVLCAISSAAHYVTISCVQVSAATLLPQQYKLNPFQTGLAFLAMGGGGTFGSLAAGRILDYDFRTTAKQFNSVVEKGKIPVDFPIYRARLRSSWIQTILMQLALVAYGWCAYLHVHLAIILVLFFIVGFVALSMYTVFQTLVVDLFPEKSASVTAVNSFVRCGLAAAGVAAVEPCIQTMGIGWTFTLTGLLLAINNLTMIILVKYGPRWRKKRMDGI